MKAKIIMITWLSGGPYKTIEISKNQPKTMKAKTILITWLPGGRAPPHRSRPHPQTSPLSTLRFLSETSSPKTICWNQNKSSAA